ncbi:uncharacterized protein METZ01_LOCUS313779, partial [marine metagenome]
VETQVNANGGWTKPSQLKIGIAVS